MLEDDKSFLHYKILNYILLGVYLLILVLYWFFSDWIKLRADSFIQHFGVSSVFALSLFIEILPSALSPPSLLLITQSVGISPIISITAMTLGSSLGGLISFHLGRKIGYKQVLRFVANRDFSKQQRIFEKYGGIALTVIALTPMPDYPIVFGSLGMSWKKYMIFGFIPRAIGFALMGYFFVAFGNFLFQ